MTVRIFPSALLPAASSRCNKLYRYLFVGCLQPATRKDRQQKDSKEVCPTSHHIQFFYMCKAKKFKGDFSFFVFGRAPLS